MLRQGTGQATWWFLDTRKKPEALDSGSWVLIDILKRSFLIRVIVGIMDN